MEKHTPYGKVVVLKREALFKKLVELLNNLHDSATVGLTGGSTPKAFYKWVIETGTLSKKKADKLIWMTSDERCVGLENDDSNFGNADRMMLAPIGVDVKAKKPWAVERKPIEAATKLNTDWNKHFDANKCFDLCILGMGDDCHTASLFPGSPLLDERAKEGKNFAAVEVPDKGWRLTVTPAGLSRSGKVLAIVTGKGKAEALKAVLEGDYDPMNKPSQIHKVHPEKTEWWIDEEAAALLSWINFCRKQAL